MNSRDRRQGRALFEGPHEGDITGIVLRIPHYVKNEACPNLGMFRSRLYAMQGIVDRLGA